MKVSGISPDKLFSNINTLNSQSSKLHNHVKEQDHNVLSIMDNASCCSVSSIQHRQLSSSNKLICGSSFLDETMLVLTIGAVGSDFVFILGA